MKIIIANHLVDTYIIITFAHYHTVVIMCKKDDNIISL